MALHTPFDVLTHALAQYLGPHATTNTVERFCRTHVGAAPERASAPQRVKVLPALQPLLSVLLGTTKADIVLSQLGKDLSR